MGRTAVTQYTHEQAPVPPLWNFWVDGLQLVSPENGSTIGCT